MTEEEIYNQLKRIAAVENLELTENAKNVARFRAKTNLPLYVCACRVRCRTMGCTRKQYLMMKSECRKYVEKNGKCFCNVFKKKGT